MIVVIDGTHAGREKVVRGERVEEDASDAVLDGVGKPANFPRDRNCPPRLMTSSSVPWQNNLWIAFKLPVPDDLHSARGAHDIARQPDLSVSAPADGPAQRVIGNGGRRIHGAQWSVVGGQLPVVRCQWSVVSGQLVLARDEQLTTDDELTRSHAGVALLQP